MTQRFHSLAQVGKGVASAGRLELLEQLQAGEMPVQALADATGLSVANTSRHLQLLKSSRLVTARRKGHYVCYRLAGEAVVRLLKVIDELAESPELRLVGPSSATETESDSDSPQGDFPHLIDTEGGSSEYPRGDFPHLMTTEGGSSESVLEHLARRVRWGEVIVLDLRSPKEFRAGHIAGARSVPMADFERRIANFSTGREVVAYGSASARALRLLRQRGFKAERLASGYEAWKSSGFPVEEG